MLQVAGEDTQVAGEGIQAAGEDSLQQAAVAADMFAEGSLVAEGMPRRWDRQSEERSGPPSCVRPSV